jgi:hypothetical protein
MANKNSPFTGALCSDDLYKLMTQPINQSQVIGLPGTKQSSGRKLGYVYDPNKLALSYSRRQTLNRCARLFQLRELQQQKSQSPSIHMSFGSAVGAGIQEYWRSESLPRAVVAALAAWDYPEFTDIWGKADKKSFAIVAETLNSYVNNIHPSLAADYKLAEIDGKSGIELFCYLHVNEHVNYQIHIDLILQNIQTNALAVVEIKTSGMSTDEAKWGNSDQTLGYYAFMESISAKLNLPLEPIVYYLCIEAGKMHDPSCMYGFQILPFVKTPNAILDFVMGLMADVNHIDFCMDMDHFPKNGSGCLMFRTRCEFYGSCDMLVGMQSQAGNVYQSLTMDDVDFVLDISELVTSIKNKLLTN